MSQRQGRSITISERRGDRPLRVAYPRGVERPMTRGDCAGGSRPCPFVSCRYHLYLDVTAVGALKLNFPHLEVDELAETCALDVAERGGVVLDTVAEHLNITRERARQIEQKPRVQQRLRLALKQWRDDGPGESG